MLAEEVALNKKYGISGSPQLIVNGVEYQGTRSSNSYKNQICAAFNNPPQECSLLKEVVSKKVVELISKIIKSF